MATCMKWLWELLVSNSYFFNLSIIWTDSVNEMGMFYQSWHCQYENIMFNKWNRKETDFKEFEINFHKGKYMN